MPRRDQAPSGASLRPAARLRLIILRPLVVFMRLRKPWRRLRVLRLQRFGYAMPMGMLSIASDRLTSRTGRAGRRKAAPLAEGSG